MSYWIKLYVEMLNDPKIGRLEIVLRWRFVEALLLAGEEGRDGYLPDPPDAAYKAHEDVSVLLNDWNRLKTAGLLAETDAGWLVVKFAERQAPSEVTERVRLHRERKQLLQKRFSNITGNTPDTESESYTDTETELREDSAPPDGFTRVKDLIEKNVGLPCQPRDVPALQELAAMPDLLEQDIIEAIAWNKENNRVVYGAAHLLGSIKYNRAKRIQDKAQASPQSGNGRGAGRSGIKRAGTLDRELARIEAEAKRGITH